MNKQYKFTILMALIMVWLLNANFLIAQTSFGAFVDNDWHNAANWTNGLPSSGNDANLGGGVSADISQDITVDYAITSYGTINISAVVTNQGTINNFFGTLNINSGGSISNFGSLDNRGTLVIAAGGGITNSETGSVSTDGGSQITINGVLTVGGNFTNQGNIVNNGVFSSVGAFSNVGIFENQNDFDINNGMFSNTHGAAKLINSPTGYIDVNTNGILQNFGVLDNCGTLSNTGEISNHKLLTNQMLFNNNNGGLLTNLFEVSNNGTMNNNNNATLVNEFNFNNDGEFNNNGYFDNGAYLNNYPAGTFNNNIGGTINNQLGSELSNQNVFTNFGTIESVGDLLNDGTFTNENLIFANNNGSIINEGSFINNNTVQNIGLVTNKAGGAIQNNGTFDILGGTVTNNGDFTNEGRVTNELDLINNQNFYNPGTVENGVRIFNHGYFENSGYLLNIGDFDNTVTGNFSNSGAIDNNDGGIITNWGEFNNTNEIFNNPCSSFINESSGILNNHWFTNKSLFWNYGVINGQPIMNMNGGVIITGATSTEVCESITASIDNNGQVLILGTSVSVDAFDNCSTLNFTVNDETELIFTCQDIGINNVTLTITDRKGNEVDCQAKVEIIDDSVPEIHDCPSDIIVATTTNSAPADWTAPTASDNCDIVTLQSTHNPSDIFPLGETVVTYTATDTQNNSAICDFTVTVVQDGDCADIARVRRVTNTHTSCGTSTAYVMWIEGAHYTGKDDLYFIEYRDGTALLTGTSKFNGTKASIYVEFSGYTETAPSGSPKYNGCVTSGGENWVYYTGFSGTITLGNCHVYEIYRKGPAFQIGVGGNIQEANEFGGSGWWMTDDGIDGDFNFRLSNPVECQRSIVLEAECANHIGSKWSISTDNLASNGQFLLPPTGTSYNTPPVGTQDLVSYEFGVTEAGHYRIYLRSLALNGSGDSYWVRVNGGSWVKWNKVNAPNQGNNYDWDQVGDWTGCDVDIPRSFFLNPGNNKIDIAWREPNIRLDKLLITYVGKKPSGAGPDATNCGNNPPNPDCKKVTLKIVPDNYGADITWTLTDGQGSVLYSGGPYEDYNSHPIIVEMCLEDGCFDFTIKDSYGDGLCCQWGDGYYQLSDEGGNVLASGANYTYSDSRTICIDDNTGNPPPCNKNALFVVGYTSLNSGDNQVKKRLENLGYTVTLVDDDYCSTSNADGKGLIVISSTVNSSKVGSKYRNSVVPVITWEAWLYDDMKMTSTGSGTNYGTYAYTSSMTIGDPSHPIVQGVSGNIPVFTGSKKVNWGNPGSGASRIGHVPNEPGCAMLFTYDRGANMVGMTAPERRVGLFLRNNSSTCLNSTGWLLFDAAVEWAAGCSSGQNLAIQPQEVLQLEAIQDERNVHLIWKNNTAFKNDLFVLERSTDGVNYEVLNEFSAFIEENKSLKIYEDLDEQPQTGVNHYRLRVDYLDGTSGYSEVQTIRFDELLDFALYPNPASDFVKINLENMQGQSISIRLYDLLGHRLQNIEIDEVSKLNHKLNLADVRDGQYMVTIYAQGRKPVTKKLFIVK